jgi:hypothetical protein
MRVLRTGDWATVDLGADRVSSARHLPCAPSSSINDCARKQARLRGAHDHGGESPVVPAPAGKPPRASAREPAHPGQDRYPAPYRATQQWKDAQRPSPHGRRGQTRLTGTTDRRGCSSGRSTRVRWVYRRRREFGHQAKSPPPHSTGPALRASALDGCPATRSTVIATCADATANSPSADGHPRSTWGGTRNAGTVEPAINKLKQSRAVIACRIPRRRRYRRQGRLLYALSAARLSGLPRGLPALVRGTRIFSGTASKRGAVRALAAGQ